MKFNTILLNKGKNKGMIVTQLVFRYSVTKYFWNHYSLLFITYFSDFNASYI